MEHMAHHRTSQVSQGSVSVHSSNVLPRGGLGGSGAAVAAAQSSWRPVVVAVSAFLLVAVVGLLFVVLTPTQPGPSHLPSCNTMSVSSFMAGREGGKIIRKSLPTLIFLAGVEGSGHDLVEKFFNFLPMNLTIQQFEPALHLTWDEAQEIDAAKSRGSRDREPEQLKPCPRLPYARSLHDFAAQVASRMAPLAEKKAVYLRARDPFPMGRIRTPLARPDLVNLAMFDGVLYNLKVVVMLRNASDAVRWGVERGFDNDDVGLQVRLLEASLVYLDASIRMLPCGSFVIINIDHIIKNPQQGLEDLAQFLEIGDIHMSDVIQALKSAISVLKIRDASSANYPKFGDTSLEKFFSIRKQLWPLLTACSHIPYFRPQHPADWPPQPQQLQ